MERDPELYSPDNIFSDMSAENLAKSIKLGEIYQTAKHALKTQKKVRVSTKIDEKFKGYISTITDKEEGQVIDFIKCELENSNLKMPRSYYTHDIDQMSTCEDSD
jgi:NAD-specific glutamate dehydrogenase